MATTGGKMQDANGNEIAVGDTVIFTVRPGEVSTGTVFRLWGTRAHNVTIHEHNDEGRVKTFARLAKKVEVVK